MEHPDDDICRKFLANPTINPKTGRTIKRDKDVYKNLVKLCKERNFDVSGLTQVNKVLLSAPNKIIITNKVLLPAPKAPNKTLTSTKVWVPKQTSIIENKTPDDLLQLYLSNVTIEKSLDNEKVIQELNKKYKTTIETNSFIEWHKYYNYVNVAKNVKYLYMLEKEQFIDPNYLDRLKDGDITQTMIAILFDWLHQVIKIFKLTSLNYCYTCTLFYIIFSNNQSKVHKLNLQMYGLIALYYSTIIFNDNYPVDLEELSYIADNAFSVELLNNTAIEVFNDLSGKLIYPSPIFFVDQNDDDLKSLVAFATSLPNLSIYKSSLIALTCKYMLTGKYTIYSIEEMSNICAKIQVRLKRSLESSLESFKNRAVNLIAKVNVVCKENQLIMDIIAKYNYTEPWHLGEFEELEEIGKGGYGEITKIKLKMCNKEYVIKSIDDNNSSYLLETSLLKLLAHQSNIISICGFIYDNQQSKIILPLMTGSVYDLVKKNQLDKSKYDKYFNQILLGIFQCHDHDLIHRDLKPQNILYDQTSDSMKIIDFGISVACQSFKNVTDTDFANTINYRSPECFLFEYENYDQKIDIWALGTILYFMVTGRNFLDVFMIDDNLTILEKIFSKLGSPTEKSYPRAAAKLEKLGVKHYDFDTNSIKELGEFSGLILRCLTVNPENRPIIEELLID